MTDRYILYKKEAAYETRGNHPINKEGVSRFAEEADGKSPLKKVTVSDIITDCNVNRKTFYYHFEDIYALLKWMLEQEAIEVVKQFDLLVDYKDAILFVLDYVEANAHILGCAYDSMGRDEMKRFFYADFIGIIQTLIDGTEKDLGLSVSMDFKEFLGNLYTEALAGVLIDWVKDRRKYNREKVLQYLSLIMRTSLPAVLTEAAVAKKIICPTN